MNLEPPSLLARDAYKAMVPTAVSTLQARRIPLLIQVVSTQ